MTGRSMKKGHSHDVHHGAQKRSHGAERRDGQRMPLKFTLPFRYGGGAGELLAGATHDINAYGLLFSTSVRPEVGERLLLFLDNLPGDRQSRAITARIIRAEIDEPNKNYLVGVKFIDLTEEMRTAIERALERTDIMALLRQAAELGASDLHLCAERPPMMRLRSALQPLREEAFSGLDVRDMIYTLLDDKHLRVFEQELELNFSLPVHPRWRWRVNVHSQRGNVEASFRQIDPLVRTIRELNLPKVCHDFADMRDGLVLITGATGSGKTTAAAAMIEHINASRPAVIITMENPIEYSYPFKQSVIKQREIGLDTRSYAVALREAMRQDPDVIFIGEVRDEETMQAAMEAAQTGHLVIATFSSSGCISAIHRLYQFFHGINQTELQIQLANCLRGILALRLFPRSSQNGVIPATEVLNCTTGIANMIRSGSTSQIKSAIQTGGNYGMHSLESSIDKLFQAGEISKETYRAAKNTL